MKRDWESLDKQDRGASPNLFVLPHELMLSRSAFPNPRTFLRLLVLVGVLTWSAFLRGQSLVVCSASDNDLYRVLKDNGVKCRHFVQARAAVEAAPRGAGVLLLAEGYPGRPTQLAASLLAQVKAKHLRLYVEFPMSLPGLQVGEPRQLKWGRGVVASDDFGPDLKRLRILDLHDCRFVPVSASSEPLVPQLVLGRVAGFDTAVFGLPTPAYPLLFETPEGHLLVAATKLSQFVTARYSPPDVWTPIWKRILHWLDPQLVITKFQWAPTVRPAYGSDAVLPNDDERKALKRGVAWFKNSHLLLTPARQSEYLRHAPGADLPPPTRSPIGDGSQGIFEGFSSTILPDGRQLQSIARRSDCTAESAMALAFGADALGRRSDAGIARRLLDFLYFKSDARKNEYADPTNGACGLIAWGMDSRAWFKATYGDDEARVLLATAASSTLLNQQRWDKAMLQCLLADLRTTGRLGFRDARIDLGPLTRLGWRHFFYQRNTYYSPHYESYLWACYLWAWQVTGYDLFRQRAETAIQMTMKAYPNHWQLVTGLQEERARMLLPLAWLVRVDDTPKHRAWLKRIATDLLDTEDPSGALPELLSLSNQGGSHPPESNEAYGTAEATLLQQNGDPVCDLLYTMNFAFLGLHEAAAATGDPFYARAEDRMARFLCRIQIQSEVHPELDGGWYRAFDFKRWEYWASSSDKGWGAWSIESGWTQSWICSVLAMRQSHTSLWDLVTQCPLKKYLARLRPVMIPDDALTSMPDDKIHDAAVNKSYTVTAPYSPSYPGGGDTALTDGILGSRDYQDPAWQGYLGDNLDVTLDLGTPVQIHELGVRFLQSVDVGIFLPGRVEFAAGNDPTELKPVATVTNEVSPHTAGPLIQDFAVSNLDCAARYVRVRAENIGRIPPWHPAAGAKAWLFVDELIVNPRKTPTN